MHATGACEIGGNITDTEIFPVVILCNMIYSRAEGPRVKGRIRTKMSPSYDIFPIYRWDERILTRVFLAISDSLQYTNVTFVSNLVRCSKYRYMDTGL